MRRFYFDLALKFRMPVGMMLRQMTSAEISQWIAYFSVKEKEAATEKVRHELENRKKALGING